MLSEEEARQAITKLLPTTDLVRADFVEVSARRLDAPAVAGGQVFPISIEVQFGEMESAVVYRVTVSVDRPDLSTFVTMLLTYSVEDPAMWLADPMLLRVFGGHVAVPTVIPLARARLREITSDMATSPVLLGLHKPTTLAPLEEVGS